MSTAGLSWLAPALVASVLVCLCLSTICLLQVLNQVQERFDVDIKPLPESVEPSLYMNTT